MQLLVVTVGFMLCVNGVWAGGYAGALERIWLYYAYRIDQFNDEQHQTMGFKCMKLFKGNRWHGAWDFGTMTCPSDATWKSCASQQTDRTRPCTLKQLINFVGAGNMEAKGDPVPPATPGTDQAALQDKPPVQESAVRYYDARMKAWNTVFEKSKRDPNTKVPSNPIHDYPMQNFLKNTNGGDYNDGIRQIGDRTIATLAAKQGRAADYVDGFRDATNKIVEARTGDHGPYLTAAARDQPWAKDMSIVTESVGIGESPVNVLQEDGIHNVKVPWEMPDWDATMKGSSLPEETSFNHIMDFLKEFYSKTNPAQHLEVLTGFDSIARRATVC